MNKSLREALLQNKEAMREALRLVGSQCKKEAAKRMTKAARVGKEGSGGFCQGTTEEVVAEGVGDGDLQAR